MAQYPVFKARLVMGSLFDLKTTNHEGKPEPDQSKHHWFAAFAVPKGPQWDALYAVMFNEAGEDSTSAVLRNQPGFNWKIEDCDNPDNPMNLGKANRPAGHMLIKMNRGIKMGAPKVVDNSRNPIVDRTAIKTGDWFYVAGGTKFNGAQSIKTNAAMYQNLDAVMFAEVGEEIVSEGGFSVNDAFAGITGGVVGTAAPAAPVAPAAPAAPAAPVAPAAPAAPVAPVAPAAPVAPVAPATDLLVTPPPVVEEKVMYNGQVFTKKALLGGGWTAEMIAQNTQAV